MKVFGAEVIKARNQVRKLFRIIYIDIEVALDDVKKRCGEEVDVLNESWNWPGCLRMAVTRTPMFIAAIFAKGKI